MIHRQVLHYLGYGGQELTDDLRARVDEMVARCEEVARPAVVRRAFPTDELPMPGEDLPHHLEGALEVQLFAVTLGHGVDRELRRLSFVDPLGQTIFDAAGSALVEQLANEVEAQVRAEARERGLFCSWRFSPGYGDLPLEVQPVYLSMLNAARRVGITLTESNLMVPTKSVTAVVGVHATPQPGLASACSVCELAEFCSLRARGVTCRA